MLKRREGHDFESLKGTKPDYPPPHPKQKNIPLPHQKRGEKKEEKKKRRDSILCEIMGAACESVRLISMIKYLSDVCEVLTL